MTRERKHNIRIIVDRKYHYRMKLQSSEEFPPIWTFVPIQIVTEPIPWKLNERKSNLALEHQNKFVYKNDSQAPDILTEFAGKGIPIRFRFFNTKFDFEKTPKIWKESINISQDTTVVEVNTNKIYIEFGPGSEAHQFPRTYVLFSYNNSEKTLVPVEMKIYAGNLRAWQEYIPKMEEDATEYQRQLEEKRNKREARLARKAARLNS